MTTVTIDLLVHPFYGMGLIPPYYDRSGAYAAVGPFAISNLIEPGMMLATSIEQVGWIISQSEEKSQEYRGMLKWLWQERIKRTQGQEHTYMGFLFSEPHKRVTPYQTELAEFAFVKLGDRLVTGAHGESDVHDRLVQRVRGYDEVVVYAFGEVSNRCVRNEGLLLSGKLTDAGIRNEARCHPVLCADLSDGKEQALAVYRTLQAQGVA